MIIESYVSEDVLTMLRKLRETSVHCKIEKNLDASSFVISDY